MIVMIIYDYSTITSFYKMVAIINWTSKYARALHNWKHRKYIFEKVCYEMAALIDPNFCFLHVVIIVS